MTYRSGVWLRALLPAGLLAVGCSVPSSSEAHTLGASHLALEAGEPHRELAVRWDIALLDLYAVIELDANADGLVTAAEVVASGPAIEREVLPKLQVLRGRSVCALQIREQLLEQRLEGFYAVLRIAARCPEDGALGVRYGLLFDDDRSHRVLLSAREAGQVSSAVLTPDERSWRSEHKSRLGTFGAFAAQGVHHIWIGYDHIAFLILLLLPAVLRVGRDGWEGSTQLAKSRGAPCASSRPLPLRIPSA
ncbi:MAG: HupE/UreJ family protein [Gammaproteobacteria bacterium]|nr:HupE/UreJ family protein [Gammaproteobacteria bacterium]